MTTATTSESTRSAPYRHSAGMVVIGLDGVPIDLLRRYMTEGVMPNLARFLRDGVLQAMDSVVPTVSSVAWSSFMTGRNPGGHGIYGFVDRQPETHEPYIPTAMNRAGRTLWEWLSEHGRRVTIINVPVTYPPRPVNGNLVAGFLCTRLEKVACPDSLLPLLRRHAYKIDVDTWQARTDTVGFCAALRDAATARFRVASELYRSEAWDYFHLHVMETDRINHFLWAGMEDGTANGRLFLEFYRYLDELLGSFLVELRPGATIMMLSDHGFCRLREEVNLNAWLRENGYLSFVGDGKPGMTALAPDSKAYSLIPGRMYVQYAGRELHGWVSAGRGDELPEELATGLAGLRNGDGETVIDQVFRGDALFHGERASLGPDMVATPVRGFDLKAGFGPGPVFSRGDISGMHTQDDAFLWMNGPLRTSPKASIVDLYPTILDILGVPHPPSLDGHSRFSCLPAAS